MADRFHLDRFVEAQAPVIETVLQELESGRKRTHWMWFVFPQLAALGRSPTAKFYGITSADEARAYLAHTLLGPRLRECTQAVLDASAPSLHALFGSPDDMKFRSCMTLFDAVDADEPRLFRTALDRWCGGSADEHTLALLNETDAGGGDESRMA
jgi:uncharacterized protein (DUF1810 family)